MTAGSASEAARSKYSFKEVVVFLTDAKYRQQNDGFVIYDD